jgi:hypothetical protein
MTTLTASNEASGFMIGSHIGLPADLAQCRYRPERGVPSLEHPRGYFHAVEKMIVYERLHFDDTLENVSNKLPILILVDGLACLADTRLACRRGYANFSSFTAS